jgi:hypothetical protein
LSGSSPLTCVAWEVLPVAYATASIALGIIWPHKSRHYAKVRIPSGGFEIQTRDFPNRQSYYCSTMMLGGVFNGAASNVIITQSQTFGIFCLQCWTGRGYVVWKIQVTIFYYIAKFRLIILVLMKIQVVWNAFTFFSDKWLRT